MYACLENKIVHKNIENVGVQFLKELAISMVMNLLSSLYEELITNNMDKTIMNLNGMLKTNETSMMKTRSSNSIALVLAIGHGNDKKKKVSHPKEKGNTKARQSNQGLSRKNRFRHNFY